MIARRRYNILWVVILIGACIAFYGYYSLRLAPKDFPVGKNFTVEENETLRSISMRLKEEHYIQSPLLFRASISSLGFDRHIKPGVYILRGSMPLSLVVNKFAQSHPDIPLISITIPEGSTLEEIAEIVHKTLPSISVSSFVGRVEEKDLRGRLFPSTYFLLPSSTVDSLVNLMASTFDARYAILKKGKTFPSPLLNDNDVISLSAILEGEAKTKEDMQMVAGILLARLEKGMLLQVDTAPTTYKVKGLPTLPINNPGEIALSSVFDAVPSPYLYYITGKDGKMYYAKTFAEHKKNIAKYLK